MGRWFVWATGAAGIAAASGACVHSSSESGGPDAGSFDAAFDAFYASDTGAVADAAPDEADAPSPDAADAAGEVDDFAGSFSASANPTPTGHFQYGSTPTLGGAFTLYGSPVTSQGMPFWQTTAVLNTPPYVAKNTTSQTVQLGATATIPAGTMWVHPGQTGQYTVIRWTCPAAGTYAANVTFTARDATTTDVAVLKDGATPALFTGNVTTTQSPAYTGTLVLNAGDTVDFAVGYGNGSFLQDSTGVAGTITAQ